MTIPIETPNAPAALGHYSQGVVGNGLIFTATQLPIDPANPFAPKGTVARQTELLLDNIFAVVRAGGGDLDTIYRVTIYLADILLWDEVDKIYTQKLGPHKPARGVLEVSGIRKGYDIAMDAIAGVKA